MYLHLGNDTIIRKNDIIGIFDLESSTLSHKTREFLSNAEKKGRVVNVSAELPKSFVLCKERDEEIGKWLENKCSRWYSHIGGMQ